MKCKVCGFRLADTMRKCPICGAGAGSTKAENIAEDANLPRYFCPSCKAEIIGEHRYCPSCMKELCEAAKQADMQEQGSNDCIQCGVPLPADAKFCHKCGAKQESSCPQCGALLLSSAKFCHKCGAQQEAVPSTKPSTGSAETISDGVEGDTIETFLRYKKAADAGYATAMLGVGIFYSNGLGGLKEDKAEALTWYKKAADAGNALAMTSVGYFYGNGLGGLKEDKKEAFSWYKKAADAGDANAMCAIGYFYHNGLCGVKEDKKEALTWYKKACEHGSIEARDYLRQREMKEDEV